MVDTDGTVNTLVQTYAHTYMYMCSHARPHAHVPVLPQATALFLIGVVIVAAHISYFVSPSILVGIAVCACVLLLVAIMGLYGTIRHHQVTMFFVSYPPTGL